ncbi:hypothetical protein [uncultured Bacteroides sp.]|uniref:hypothetical protein n=1 Tax=uncultured Bacteroides sp. TaxID=162156 RepID=UPI002AAB674E|nr:hypothetical protein [uncultured Bacteroides sp.]
MENNLSEFLWKEYEKDLELYKFYFNMAIKIIMWYLSVIGAVYAFFISNQTVKYISILLVIPIFLSFLLMCLSASSISVLNHINDDLKDFSNRLNLKSYPNTIPLIWIMPVCVFAFTLVMVVFSVLLLNSI